MTMKNASRIPLAAKILQLSDFRIDFAAATALIVLPQLFLHAMPADLPQAPAPLAEISQAPSAFEQFLDRNQKNIIILAILIALGTAVYVVYRGIEDSRQQTAGTALNKAEDLASLQSVITDHAGTSAAKTAMVLLADKQWAAGQQDAAIETLRKFIAENPSHPALGSAKASLGSKLMGQGKGGDAAAIFQELADSPGDRFIAPFALISLGDIARAAGDTTKAESHYNRVKSDFPDSGFVQSSTQRIASIKAKAPVEIDPPPAPKPEEKPADPTTGAQPAPTPGITVTPADPQAPAAPAPVQRPATSNVEAGLGSLPVIPSPQETTAPVTPPQPAPPEAPAQEKPVEAETPAQESPAPAGNQPKPEPAPEAPKP